MNGKIPCDVIRDLLPSYADELTSKASNELIMDHLRDCASCRKALASMRGGPALAEEAERARKEIDFLKKNKRRNRRFALASILGALLIVAAIFAVRVFLVGSRDYSSWVPANLQVKGRSLTFTAVPIDSAMAVSGLDYEEADGVVTIRGRSVLASPLHRGSFAGIYAASEDIREVRAGSRIVWAEGATVSPLAADLFETRHDYVGDMPANNKTAQALNLGSYLGPYTNELETMEEPYGWIILLSSDIDSGRLEQKERDMEAFGKVLLALVGNLDHVTFSYTADGQEATRTITADEASAFLGQDIKNCARDVRVLDELVKKTGLSMYAFSAKEGGEGDESWIKIMNQTDTKLFSISCGFYKNGKLKSSSHGMNADESPVGIGESFWVSMSPLDFGSLEGNPAVEVEISFKASDGTKIVLPERLRVAARSGVSYELTLTGNEADGYKLE